MRHGYDVIDETLRLLSLLVVLAAAVVLHGWFWWEVLT